MFLCLTANLLSCRAIILRGHASLSSCSFSEDTQSRLLIIEAKGYDVQSTVQWLCEDAALMHSQSREL